MSNSDREFAQFAQAVHFALIDHAARNGERLRFSQRERIAREAWRHRHPGSTAGRPWDRADDPTPSGGLSIGWGTPGEGGQAYHLPAAGDRPRNPLGRLWRTIVGRA